jgi:glycerol uptake facilitator-like aquaporin
LDIWFYLLFLFKFTGYAINPVRDFIPRVFTAIFGWGVGVFSTSNYFFWVPLIGPFIGAILAAIIYTLMIGNSLHDEAKEKEKDEQNPAYDLTRM